MVLNEKFTVKDLKEILNDLPDDMPVYVACNEFCNYNNILPQTHTEIIDGKLFITDENRVQLWEHN